MMLEPDNMSTITTGTTTAAASPSTDSLEQFGSGVSSNAIGSSSMGGGECNSAAATPLSAMLDDCVDTATADSNSSHSGGGGGGLLLHMGAPMFHSQSSRNSASPSPFDSNSLTTTIANSTSMAGRFRRHSSQSSSLVNIPLNLSLSSSYGGHTSSSVCNGPISGGAGAGTLTTPMTTPNSTTTTTTTTPNGLMSPLTVTSTTNGNAAAERVCSVNFKI